MTIFALVAGLFLVQDAAGQARMEQKGEVDLGREYSDQLNPTDFLANDDHRVAAWHFRGEEGRDYSVSLASGDFDAYLSVIAPTANGVHAYPILTDDDSGDERDAWLCFTAPASGQYTVEVRALTAGTGEYTLRVDRSDCKELNPHVLSLLDSDSSRTIDLDQGHRGHLQRNHYVNSDGKRVVAWRFTGGNGVTYSVSLSSEDFDAYLYVLGPAKQLLDEDDDSGVELNARLCFATHVEGIYTVIVGALAAGIGEYTVRVNRGDCAGDQPFSADGPGGGA